MKLCIRCEINRWGPELRLHFVLQPENVQGFFAHQPEYVKDEMHV
jgi:hypothetical protein